MFEDFINALQNFRLNKTRTFLSLLGVIIGVASVILITTLGQSATANVKKSFGSSGFSGSLLVTCRDAICDYKASIVCSRSLTLLCNEELFSSASSFLFSASSCMA